MDNSPIMFKGAINGFDKKAVISYIFELNEANQAAQAKLTEQLEDAVEAKETAERKLAEIEKTAPKLEGELSNLETELSGERSRIAELSEMVDNLNTEVEHLREELDRRDAEAGHGDEMEEKLRQIEEDRGKLFTKEQEVERASAQIGRLLLDATANADGIREKAVAEAERLLERARAEASEILRAATADSEASATEARAKANEIIADAGASLDEANRRFGIFRQEFAALQKTILDTAEAMKNKAETAGNVVEMLDVKMNTSLDERLEPAPYREGEKPDLFRFPK